MRCAGAILASVLAIWSLVALVDKGESGLLPWMPILNALDIMVIIVFITLVSWWKQSEKFKKRSELLGSSAEVFTLPAFKNALKTVFALLTFLWLNFTLFRIAHHWFTVPYNEHAMYASSLVQTSVSILWAFIGVVLTLFSSHRHYRFLWMTGALLLGLVILKLFIVDLSALGSLGRIISFLVVGFLLTSIGYFAPIPDKENSSKS